MSRRRARGPRLRDAVLLVAVVALGIALYNSAGSGFPFVLACIVVGVLALLSSVRPHRSRRRVSRRR